VKDIHKQFYFTKQNPKNTMKRIYYYCLLVFSISLLSSCQDDNKPSLLDANLFLDFTFESENYACQIAESEPDSSEAFLELISYTATPDTSNQLTLTGMVSQVSLFDHANRIIHFDIRLETDAQELLALKGRTPLEITNAYKDYFENNSILQENMQHNRVFFTLFDKNDKEYTNRANQALAYKVEILDIVPYDHPLSQTTELKMKVRFQAYVEDLWDQETEKKLIEGEILTIFPVPLTEQQ
jgi:hypothetical protein